MLKWLLPAILSLLLVRPGNTQIADPPVNHRLPVVLITAGYVPNPMYNAFKMTLAGNNLFLKRFGLYTSMEAGTTSSYFTNIYGATGTINKYVYAWGGIDLFSTFGLFTSKSGIRKEMGLGFIPFDFALVKAGWSFDVGLTLEAGIRLDLQPLPGL